MFHVLLPVDTNIERAKEAARAVTELPGSPDDISVTILNVFIEAEARGEGANYDTKHFYDPEDFPESAHAAKDILEGDGIAVTLRRELGDPTEEILSVADELNVDCIALSGRKRSPTRKALFGSVTQDVLLNSNTHVYLTIKD